ncbi:MAG: hypothetical protein Q9191_003210 [Dirinaria sp. TL-2023a]
MAPPSQPSRAATAPGKWIAPDSWNNQPVAIAVIVFVVVGVVGGLLICHFRRRIYSKQRSCREELNDLRSAHEKLATRLRCPERTFPTGLAYPEPVVTASKTSTDDFAPFSNSTTHYLAPIPTISHESSATRRDGSISRSPPGLRISPSPPPPSSPSELSPLSLSPPEFPQTGNT